MDVKRHERERERKKKCVYLFALPQGLKPALGVLEREGISPTLGLSLQDVDEGVLQQRGEDEAETRRHPDIDSLDVRHL